MGPQRWTYAGTCNAAPEVMPSNTTALGGPATVVRHRRDIGDLRDANAQCRQRPNRGLAPWPWAFDFDFKVFDALFNRRPTRHLRRHLSRKGCGLTRALKPLTAR